MTSESSRVADGPVHVYFSWPERPDLDRLAEVLGDERDRVEVICGPTYKDSSAARTAKRSKQMGDDDLVGLEAPLSDAHREAYAAADVVVAVDTPHRLTDLAPRLRWVQTCGAGVGQFNEVELARRGVVLTNGAGLGAAPIAEFVIGRLLMVYKDFRGLEALQAERRWEFHPGRMLAGRSMVVLGLGAIGGAIATRARAFGVHTIGVRRRRDAESVAIVDELHGPDALDELLPTADIVVAALPDTPETYHLFDADRLALLRADAVLCNVGRGTLIDEPALLDLLRAGKPASVILDVAATEPLPPEHPLWSFDNVFLSPHSSMSEDGYEQRLSDLVGGNLLRFLRGEQLLNEVDYEQVRTAG